MPESHAAVPYFWENLAKAGGETVIDSVDFIGHNFDLVNITLHIFLELFVVSALG